MKLRVFALPVLLFALAAYQSPDEWKPLGGMMLGPIVWSGECGENLMVGLDKNRNHLIDHCYCVKMISERMHYKRLKIFYEYDRDTMVLEKQGCVCE